MFELTLMFVTIVASSTSTLRCGIDLPLIVLKNPAGYTETMLGLPTISVQRRHRYQVGVTFEPDVPPNDLSRLRRVVVFERVASMDCDRKPCWSEIARFSSRNGVKQSRTIRPRASEIIVASWHVAQKDSNATGAASAAGCSAGPSVQSLGSTITLRLPSPYGEQVVTVQQL